MVGAGREAKRRRKTLGWYNVMLTKAGNMLANRIKIYSTIFSSAKF